MVDLPRQKVGIVACSGEELAEGTVTRLAALQVLENLRSADTVTICLPLFLAGGEGDRAFARFYPTIAVDGCEKRCAARATAQYSGKPAASIVVSEIVSELNLEAPAGKRRLNDAGKQAVTATAERIAETVDDLLGKRWNRKTGRFSDPLTLNQPELKPEPVPATCSCGSGIPVQKVVVNGEEITLVALPLIFQHLQKAGKAPSESLQPELLETVGIYNPLPAGEEAVYGPVLLEAYRLFWEKDSVT